MLPLILFLLVFHTALFVAAQTVGDLQSFTSHGGGTAFHPPDPCMVVFPPCMNEADRYSLEALRNIHQMMDDDQDGGIEVEESMEFIIEDMKQQQQTQKHSKLHREDQHITVEELWRGWKSSEVHNWTQDEVLQWLKEFVELPQYERNFKDFKANGNTLPRIAANEPSFLSGQLKILDQRDKQKLNIKALDVVLFGAPTRPPHNYMKDFLLIVSVVMGVGGCWFAQAQSKASKVHIAKMMKDLESLQRAEQSLTDLQEQLELAQEEKRNVAEEKQNLEEKMRDEIMGAQEEAHRLHELRQGAVSELSRLRYAEEELEQVRGALKQAEKEMLASWTVSGALQQWLQLTHEIEVQYYNVKKHGAELQLNIAKEEAEKIKKKRSSVLGTLHVAHSSSLDQVDHKIMEAKNALSEVTACLRERLHRWQQIELLCGFPLLRNPGLVNLTAQLYSESMGLGLSRAPQSSRSCHSSIHGSVEDLLDEPTSPILPQMSVPPLKRSPRLRGSTIRRVCHPGVVPQPPAALISPDPDLLIPIRAPYPRYDEGEELVLTALKKQDSQEKFLDSDYVTPVSLSKVFHTSTADHSSRRFYLDESEPFSDCFVTKHLSEKIEAVAESPLHKRHIEEHETSSDLDVCRRKITKERILDPSLETSSLKSFGEESFVNMVPQKISNNASESPMEVSCGKGFSDELEKEFSLPKMEKDAGVDLRDLTLRNVHREKCNLPQDMRTILRNELEASINGSRKISRDMMGSSMDSVSKKMTRDDAELLRESRRIVRKNSMGTFQDTSSLKHPLNTGESHHEASMRALAKDQPVDTAIIPQQKISRDELEYCTDSASSKMLPREMLDEHMDISSSTDMQDFSLEPPTSRGLPRNENDGSVGSLRRRIPKIPRDDIRSSSDPFLGKMYRDRVDVPMEAPKQVILRDELGANQVESSSLPSCFIQPDLMLTSQVPWKSSSDLHTVGPLSQLVYDGILEKSCSPTASIPTNLSASTPNLPQSRLHPEFESPVPPLKDVLPPLAPPPESGDDKNKDRDKSKKTLKLKNLFKKKNEPPPEKLQSGLQKL
ncbi:stromal interaction molecule 2 [Nothobranchius furzeri]|uniref:Stromal interaction molecule 2 n=1 Tax=Nothobranchius furzeri TaxID=105023 RepID=A0A8C6KN28_NOTFU|nr:stromal interaction molecule 2-like [Nothobranchius furzeri]